MEKKEESDLLELQELALKYRTGTKFHLDAAQKRMIVKAYLVNHVPMVQLCEKFNVSRISIYRWIRTFAPQTLNMIEQLSAEPIQQKQGLREDHSTSARV